METHTHTKKKNERDLKLVPKTVPITYIKPALFYLKTTPVISENQPKTQLKLFQNVAEKQPQNP